MTTTKDYTRADLLAICERAFVAQESWTDRDSSGAQTQLGQCYALLRAGCDFVVMRGNGGCSTDARAVWVEVTYKGFGYFDYGGNAEDETFYLPTVARLDDADGQDWY